MKAPVTRVSGIRVLAAVFNYFPSRDAPTRCNHDIIVCSKKLRFVETKQIRLRHAVRTKIVPVVPDEYHSCLNPSMIAYNVVIPVTSSQKHVHRENAQTFPAT